MKRTADIKGYKGIYRISVTGDIISLPRRFTIKGARVLKRHMTRDGYHTAHLCKYGKVKVYSLHRLIYEHFVGKIPKEKQINHKDGDKLNNSLSNLEVVTPKENTQHAWRIGLRKKVFGEQTSNVKLKNEDVLNIVELHEEGFINKEIAEKFDVDISNIHYILSGKTWSHVTKITA